MTRTKFIEGNKYGPHDTLLVKMLPMHVQPSGKKISRAIFKCSFCGQEFEASCLEVNRGNAHSCGCYRKISKAKTHLKDISGQHNEYMLTAIKRLDKQSSNNSYYWLCQCDCGNFTEIPISDFHKVQSCGCLLFKSGGEELVKQVLQEYQINYISQHKFQDCRSNKNILLRFDFYLPEYNTCIEVDGRQHFEPVSRFGGKESFRVLQENDSIKNEYCKQNNICLIRIPYIRRHLSKKDLITIFKENGLLK